MGLKYTSFRVIYELKRRLGIFRLTHPVSPPMTRFISLEHWKNSAVHFFWAPGGPRVRRSENSLLKERIQRIRKGEYLFFYGNYVTLPRNNSWMLNPKSGYQYHPEDHWSSIPTFSAKQGDIKYVWEKSRFCFLYDIIRYDHHFQEDQSKWAFEEILSWIDANNINCGPHYTCSQEISIRCLNWLFALNYYRESANLNEEIFTIIIHHIYWQIRHVAANMKFSRVAVRNNHTLTEAFALYAFGLLFPEFPQAAIWKNHGKQWFKEEIDYQIYSDGTFLQYSMNYNRVVVQLLTWNLLLAKKNQDHVDPVVFEKAGKTLEFLLACIDQDSGELPNYGANDGALFFKLSESEFRDYRPQLNALHFILHHSTIFDDANSKEELEWYGINTDVATESFAPASGANSFKESGYYIFRETKALTFIRCGNHINRPSQADNLHLDLWYEGKNIMRDSGSFQYNTEVKWRDYFTGTRAHNTVLVNGKDQMERGPHFIWLNWTQCEQAELDQDEEKFAFTGAIRAFQHLGFKIVHTRKVTKLKNMPHWIIEDRIDCSRPVHMTQVWNPIDGFLNEFRLTAKDEHGHPLEFETRENWYSNTYGHKEKGSQFQFNGNGNYIRTEIIRREMHI